MLLLRTLLAVVAVLLTPVVAASEIDEDQLGAWYMYFWNWSFEDSQFGMQGDAQYRNWDLLGDLEQLLIRGGFTWSPASNDLLFTLGYASITSGEFGDGDETTHENRMYQEALIPQRIGNTFLRHRLRYEQRWVDDQDFRTRYRYALFIDVPLTGQGLARGAWYLAFYNELFINGQRDIGGGREVDWFDRNRTYGALGYSLTDTLRIQGGYMYQVTEDTGKGQLQLSLHQFFR